MEHFPIYMMIFIILGILSRVDKAFNHLQDRIKTLEDKMDD